MKLEDIQELYCRLYIHSAEDEEAIKNKIANSFGGKISSRRIRDDYLEFYFSKNNSFDEKLYAESVGGFVYSRYTAEASPLHEIMEHLEPVDTDIYFDILCHIIKSLRDMGCEVVAACDYEELIEERTLKE